MLLIGDIPYIYRKLNVKNGKRCDYTNSRQIDFKADSITREEREAFHNDKRFDLPGYYSNSKCMWIRPQNIKSKC